MTLLYRGRHAAKPNYDPAPADDPTRLAENTEAIEVSMTTTPTSVVGEFEQDSKVSRPVRP